MPHHEENNFSAPAEVVDFSALLFDMDGTIIDSTPAIVKYWQETGRQIGVDGDGEWRERKTSSESEPQDSRRNVDSWAFWAFFKVT